MLLWFIIHFKTISITYLHTSIYGIEKNVNHEHALSVIVIDDNKLFARTVYSLLSFCNLGTDFLSFLIIQFNIILYYFI